MVLFGDGGETGARARAELGNFSCVPSARTKHLLQALVSCCHIFFWDAVEDSRLSGVYSVPCENKSNM